MPFLDRKVLRTGRSPLFDWLGVLFLIYAVGMTAWGYKSWLPVGIVIGAILLIRILGLATRPTQTWSRSDFQ